MPAVHCRIPLLVDQQYIIRIATRAFHSGRTMRHAWSGQANSAGTLLEKPLDILCGHVAFNRITVNQEQYGMNPSVVEIPARSRASLLPTSWVLTVKPFARIWSTHFAQHLQVELL